MLGALCSEDPAWMELRFGYAAGGKQVTAHHTVSRHIVSNESFSINRQGLMYCWSGCDGSKIAWVGGMTEKSSKVSGRRQAQWDTTRMNACMSVSGKIKEPIQGLLGLIMSAGYGCLKTWARLNEKKQICPQLFYLATFHSAVQVCPLYSPHSSMLSL